MKDESLAPAEDAVPGRASDVAKRKRRPLTWLLNTLLINPDIDMQLTQT